MCGICGFTGNSSSENSKTLMNQMLDKILHRGPDNTDTFHNDSINLGHVRLSIIDLNERANQPFILFNRYVLTYNGEVYNYKSLRQELAALGCSFQTDSDTEVVLMGFIHLGVEFFQKMNGMFALAIYDMYESKLLLVRDRFGIKPLYYTYHNGQLVFASEVKSILTYTQQNILNANAMSEFLYFGNALGTHTMHKDVFQVEPGHHMEYDVSAGTSKTHSYWKVEDHKNIPYKELPRIKNELLKRLENGVERHLVSDVPVGIFLSGGIDSSLIAYYASKHSAEKITAYTASFEFDKGVNEVEVARRFSTDLGIGHQEIKVSTGDLPDIIEKLVHHHDSPFSDAANIPLYLMSKLVKSKHKVILQGDGGDEFFGGYRRYKLLSKYNKGLKIDVLRALSPLLSMKPIYKERVDRITDIFHSKDDGEKMARLLTAERPSYSPLNILSKEFRQKFSGDSFSAYKEMSDRFSDLDIVQKMLYTDTQIILPNIFLEKVDRSTMANGVEVRIPFLDNEITEYALGLSASTKLLNGRQKGLLLDTIDGVLPDYLTKRKKAGFSVPFENWLKKPLREMFFDYLNSSTVADLGLFDQTEVERCYELHANGKSDKGFLLWKLLNLNIWLHRNRMILD